jgi:hypothetical protein
MIPGERLHFAGGPMRTRISTSLVGLALVVALAWVWAEPVQVQSVRADRWEYCILGSHWDVDSYEPTTVAVRYLTADGFREVGFPALEPEAAARVHPTRDFHRKMSAAIARLGADGWELVDSQPADARSPYTGFFRFKRPLK